MAHPDAAPDARTHDAKHRISDAGLDLFLRDGFENVSVDAIADAAGVSRRTVFRYFRTKQEIPFPDHSGRLELQQQILDSVGPHDDPFEVFKRSGRAVMADFLVNGGIVLKRYQLARREVLVREREYIENAHYTSTARAFLARHFTGEDRELKAEVYSAAFDAVHRSVLRDWARSGGKTEAQQQLADKTHWVHYLLRAELPPTDSATRAIPADPEHTTPASSDSVIVAVLPSTAENMHRIDTLLSQSTLRHRETGL